MIDLPKMLLDPTAVFQHPQQVLAHPALTTEQKREILQRWAYDAKELETADNENMFAESSHLLDEVLNALHQLDEK